jgi:hypothetical protein
MAGLKPEETKQVKGMTLRCDPAREDCFHVVDSDAEMQEWPGMTEISQRQRIHRHMNNETGAMDQNRTFEAGELDLLGQLPAKWREVGDERTAEVLESILSDEITHVRFANQWLKVLVREDRRLLLKIVMAVRFLTTVTSALAPKEGELSPVGLPFEEPQNRITQVNVADRRQAEFSDSEIDEYLRQSGFQSIVTTNAEG